MQVITITRSIKINLANERARLSRKLQGEQRDRLLALMDAFAANDMPTATKLFVHGPDEDCKQLNPYVIEALQEAALQDVLQNPPEWATALSKRPMRSIATVSVH
jgi:hypothetical protein